MRVRTRSKDRQVLPYQREIKALFFAPNPRSPYPPLNPFLGKGLRGGFALNPLYLPRGIVQSKIGIACLLVVRRAKTLVQQRPKSSPDSQRLIRKWLLIML